VSPEAIDLLQNMLRADPRQRLSLADVMAHPWVVQECSALQEGDDNDEARHSSHQDTTADGSVTLSTTGSSPSGNINDNNTRGRGICVNHRLFLTKRAVVHFDPSVVGQKDEGCTSNSKNTKGHPPQQQQPCSMMDNRHPNINGNVVSSQQQEKQVSSQQQNKEKKKNVLQPLGEHHFEV
jgi:serine/threonine protein kinase